MKTPTESPSQLVGTPFVGIPPAVVMTTNPMGVIGNAINEVMGGVKKLERDANNKFASYSYASIDKFLDMLRPLLTTAGLTILQEEIAYDTKQIMSAGDSDRGAPKERTLLFITFGFRLLHKSGAMWPQVDRYATPLGIKRTVSVQAGGAQAWGSAQSYALKQFCRSLFMIATGEKDEDADAAEPIEILATTNVITMLNPMASQAMASIFIDDVGKLDTPDAVEQRFLRLKQEGRGLANADKKAAMDAFIASLARVTTDDEPEGDVK